MDAETILATARSGNAPGTWVVWPLRRSYVRNSILRWLAVSVIGFLFLVPVALTAGPSIFSLRGFAFVIAGLILLALATLAFGALGIVLYDSWRLLHADDYWLVVTPDDFVKSMPRGRVISVPLEYVESITLKGVKVRLETAETFTRPVMPAILGGAIWSPSSRRERATSPSLAFVDTRTGQQVVVATDASFDDLQGIEYVLSMQAESKQRQINRSRSG